MNIEQRISVAIVLLVLLVLVFRLVLRRQLSVNQGIIWTFLLIGSELLIMVPALLEFVTRVTGAVFPVSALTLLALTTMVLLLLQMSIALSRLQRRLTELAHAVGGFERRLRKSIRDET